MTITKRYGKKAGIALDMWVKLARAFGMFSKHALCDIRRYELTQPQFAIVEILGHLGPLTLGELAKKQLSSCGNITVVVDNLEKEDLVLRKPSKEDRRSLYVHLTPKGEQMFDEMFHQHAQHITKLASVLTEKEQQQLAGLLRKLGLGLKDMV
jgi:MarR family transcriptional regulator, 2-MHQ and catechol-resistance regulon repressor